MSKILVVDDEAHYVDIIVAVLNRNGHEAQGCSDPKNALTLIQSFHPDVLMSDIMMPELNGYELCRLAREAAPGLIIVLMSGNNSLSADDLKIHGAKHFLQKPFPMKSLIAVLQDLLKLS